MKRRVNALSSSTQAAKKKRAWQEEDDEDDDDDDDDEVPAKSAKGAKRPPPPPPPDSDDDLLRDRIGSDEEDDDEDKKAAPPPQQPAGPNPVVWMDLSVAGKAVGRIHFELFRDLCPLVVGNFRRLCTDSAGYQGSEFDTIVPGSGLEGGDLDNSVDLPAIERDCSKLSHAKAGLLSMSPGNPSFGSSRFQLTLGPRPDLDGKQVVFGQLLAPGEGGLPPDKLSPLHWVEAVGAPGSGAPREAVVVEACGECDTDEQQALLGAMVLDRAMKSAMLGSASQVAAAQIDRTKESQDDRYGRAGTTHGRLVDAVTGENLVQVLDLTEDLLEHLQYSAKKLKTDSQKDRKAKEMEVRLKDMVGVLEKVQHKAGEVSGFDNKLASKAKDQLNGAKELEASLARIV